MSSLTRSTVLVTILNTLGIGVGFVSTLVIAGIFGSGVQMDVYLAATALPLFIISIISGSLNITFIPVFAEFREKKDAKLWKIVSSILNINMLITIVITIGVILAATPLMHILAPGFSSEKIDVSTEILRWQMPVIIMATLNELMASIYYSNQKFVVPLLNKVISPLVTILFVILFSKYVNIKSLVFATLTGMFVQTVLLSVGFKKSCGFEYYFIFDFQNSGVKKVFKLMLPLIGSMLFYRIIPLFDRFLASGLPEGSISYLGYSFKIFSQIPSIISTGIAISLFPMLAHLATKEDLQAIKLNMSKGIRMVLFISIPFVFIFVIYGYPVIDLFFHRGAFTSNDTLQTSKALAVYILALPVAVMGDIISKGYYIFQDTITPAIVGVIETLIYIMVAYFLLPRFGFLSIPIAYAVYFNLSIINGFIVRKKIGGTGGSTIVKSFLKYLIGAIIAFSIIYFPIKLTHNLVLQNILIASAVLFYVFICAWIIKTAEAVLIWNKLILLYNKNRCFTSKIR